MSQKAEEKRRFDFYEDLTVIFFETKNFPSKKTYTHLQIQIRHLLDQGLSSRLNQR
jgi:hypothetical protein